MNDLQPKTWQQKAIQIYDTYVYDISFDHISLNLGYKGMYEIHELGFEECPVCKNSAPIVNFNFHQPTKLIKMCECGYEKEVLRPELFKSFCRSQ